MVILIGGAGYAGKTFMAQQLLEKYKFPYLSIDHLKMGLYRADIGCGFTPTDDFEFIAEKLWPILKGIIMTVIENKQHIIIEGCYLLPQRINELENEYLKEVIPFYLFFTNSYIDKNFHSEILNHRNVIEARGYDHDDSPGGYDTAREYQRLNEKYKQHCINSHAIYFEINDDYQVEINKVYDWLDKKLFPFT